MAVAVVVVQVVEGELPEALLAGPAVEEELRVDPPVGGGYDGGAVGERTDDPQDPLDVVRAVQLVDDDQVGEGQVPVDLGVLRPGAVELGGVDDLDQAAVDDARVLAGEHHAHEFLGLGQPAGLDDDHVDPGAGRGEPVQVEVEFARVDGTAQAAVAERDGRVAQGAGDGHRVDLDGPEVVDDGSDPAASAAVQQMIEERGLSGAQETGEHDDRNLLRTAAACQAVPQRATSLTYRSARFAADARTGMDCPSRIRAGRGPKVCGRRCGDIAVDAGTRRSARGHDGPPCHPAAGTAASGSGPTYRATGRMIFESAACSRTLALQPTTRPAAKVGVNISRGRPHSSMTTPA